MKIRSAEKRDYHRINELYEQVDRLHREVHPDRFQKPAVLGRPDEFLNALVENESSYLIVAEEREEIIGFAEAYIVSAPNFPVLKQRSWLLIDSIAVDEGHRGMGTGQKLFDYLGAKAKERGVEEVELNVYAFNDSAIKFYEKNGFKELCKTMTKRL